MPSIRAIYVSTELTVIDQHDPVPTPTGALDDLAVLLTRVAAAAHPNGATVLLDANVLPSLGLPSRQPSRTIAAHPALDHARSVGWNCREISPWMTFWRRDRLQDRGASSVHIGVWPWLRAATMPFYGDGDPIQAVRRLYLFHRLAVVPYHGGNAGLSAIDLMRDGHSGRPPMWTPTNWDRIPPASAPTEVWPEWEALEPAAAPFTHVLDAHRQYLSVAGSLSLAVGELVRQPRPGRPGPYPVAGYYKIVTPAWRYAHVLPHPIGNRPDVGAERWVTAPTLQLLNDLAERWDVVDEPEVLDAWIAGPSKDGKKPAHQGRVLQSWAGRIREAIDGSASIQDPQLTATLKNLYKHGLGMIEHAAEGGGRVYRPDWAHAIIGAARSIQFRKIWTTFQDQSERAPVRVEWDQVWFASLDADPAADWPSGFPQGSTPGGYTVKETIKGTK